MTKPLTRYRSLISAPIIEVKGRIEFVPQDIWIGVYWRKHMFTPRNPSMPPHIDVYICLLPCFPLHMRIVDYRNFVWR